MGAVSFSLDKNLVDALQIGLPINILVETGTFHGNTLFNLKDEFEQLISIENSKTLWKQANNNFAGYGHIQTIHGDSAEQLGRLYDDLNRKPVLYWLDAHWCCAAEVAGENSQCPLLAELEAIKTLNEISAIVIDDARLFLSTPPIPHDSRCWPKFNDISGALKKLSDKHGLMVVNDVIVYYPFDVEGLLERYAREYSVDWLSVLENSREYEALGASFRENAKSLNVLKHKYDLLLTSNREKDQQIRNMRAEIEAMEFPNWFRRVFTRPITRFREIVRPRLGHLNQYAARPLTIDEDIIAPPISGNHTLVSIITPSFSQVDYIQHTMDSVLEQNYPNIEYFVQDGGSDDGTVEILERFDSRLSGWESKPDTGQSQAINRGFCNTSGDIMGWLNSDDMLLPGALNTVADYFNRHPDIDVVYGNRLMIDENSMEIGRWILPGHDDGIMSWVDYIPQESLYWRRSIWEKAGGMVDETYAFAMDWDLLVRFRDAGAKFAHIPRFLGAFRVHQQQKSSSILEQQGWGEMDRIRERIHGYVPKGSQVRRKVTPYLVKHLIKDMQYRIKSRIP